MHDHLIRSPSLHKTTVNDCIGFIVKSAMSVHACNRQQAIRHLSTLIEVEAGRATPDSVQEFAREVEISERNKLAKGVGTAPEISNVVKLELKAS